MCRFALGLNIARKRLEARLHPDPLGELTAHSLIKGKGGQRKGDGRKGGGKEEKGRRKGGENDIPLFDFLATPWSR